MDRARILNLLDTMETRIERLEKTFASDVSNSNATLSEILRDIKTKARRIRSKIDIAKASDIADVRADVNRIRHLSSTLDRDFLVPIHAQGYREASEVLRDDASYFENLLNGMVIGLNLTGDQIRDLLPGQKPAAVRFAFDNDNQRIIIANEPFRPAAKQADMATAALEEIISQGAEVNEDLQQTNAAPRLKSAFARLQERLAAHRNIVQVGQCNSYASRMLTSYVEELSNSQYQQLRAHVEGVAQVLSQFPEWRIFCENAVEAALDDTAIAELRKSASATAELLRKNRSAADEVPDAIDEVVEWVNESQPPDKRDVLSLARSLENLWSFLTKNALAKAVKDEAVKTVARAIIVATLAAVGLGFAPILSKVPGAEWIEPTAAYLKAHVSSFLPK